MDIAELFKEENSWPVNLDPRRVLARLEQRAERAFAYPGDDAYFGRGGSSKDNWVPADWLSSKIAGLLGLK